MDISISYYSATGGRRNNEDAVSIQECKNGLLALVADGLGGHSKGEVASAIATGTVSRLLLNRQPNEKELIESIYTASDEIFREKSDKSQMKTTIAALWLGDYMAIAANVGDSRIYQFRDGKIVYQSVDHSVAQMAVLVGELRAEDVRTSQDRNKLIRVLGNEKPPKVDSEILSVRKGDSFLICSDGFWEPITEPIMLATRNTAATAKDWLAKMKQMIENINNPDQDNHTAIAVIVND